MKPTRTFAAAPAPPRRSASADPPVPRLPRRRRTRPIPALPCCVGLLAAVAACDGDPGEAETRVEPDLPAAAATAEPERFAPGVVSDEREQYRVTFTPSGDTAYFAVADGFFPQTREAAIHRSIRVDGSWRAPEVASFSGEFPDIDPFVEPGGGRLYFSSIRPAAGTTDVGETLPADIWVVEREGEEWSEPSRVEASTSRDDLFPSVDADGNLYFGNATGEPDAPGLWRIVVSRPTEAGYGAPEPVPGRLGSGDAWEFNPAVSPDGRRLVFTRLDPAEAAATGFGELHVSFLGADGWSEPTPLGEPVNTGQDEYHPSFSPDGSVLYFVRRDPLDPDAVGDLYRIPVARLGDRLTPP